MLAFSLIASSFCAAETSSGQFGSTQKSAQKKAKGGIEPVSETEEDSLAEAEEVEAEEVEDFWGSTVGTVVKGDPSDRGKTKVQVTDEEEEEIEEEEAPAPQVQQPRTTAAGPIPITYQSPTKPRYRSLLAVLQNSGLFEQTVTQLAHGIKIPPPLRVTFQNCGDPNAFYDPEKKLIVMCYELADDMKARFSKPDEDGEQSDRETVENGVLGGMLLILIHELGHAFVDVLDLPITGREEDSVDNLAAMLLLQSGDVGTGSIYFAVAYFADLGDDDQNRGLEMSDFEDEHSLPMQRAYALLCLMYGSNPEEHESLVTESTLSPERAEKCVEEYAQQKRSWERLLAPHMQSVQAANAKPDQPVKVASNLPVLLITRQEAALGSYRTRFFSSSDEADGPVINVSSPLDGTRYASPMPVKVTFKANKSEVDISTLEVTYLKLFGIDITDRVLPYITKDGIDLKDAQLPEGRHRIRFSISDKSGATSSMTLAFEVLES